MVQGYHPVTMRSAPSVSSENLSNFTTKSGSQLGGAPSSIVNDFSSTKVGNIQLAGLSSMTDKNALRLFTNNSTANRLVVVLDFGGNKTATNGTFTITFPDPTTPSNAIISMA